MELSASLTLQTWTEKCNELGALLSLMSSDTTAARDLALTRSYLLFRKSRRPSSAWQNTGYTEGDDTGHCDEKKVLWVFVHGDHPKGATVPIAAVSAFLTKWFSDQKDVKIRDPLALLVTAWVECNLKLQMTDKLCVPISLFVYCLSHLSPDWAVAYRDRGDAIPEEKKVLSGSSSSSSSSTSSVTSSAAPIPVRLHQNKADALFVPSAANVHRFEQYAEWRKANYIKSTDPRDYYSEIFASYRFKEGTKKLPSKVELDRRLVVDAKILATEVPDLANLRLSEEDDVAVDALSPTTGGFRIMAMPLPATTKASAAAPASKRKRATKPKSKHHSLRKA
jgi:hypothetical protein